MLMLPPFQEKETDFVCVWLGGLKSEGMMVNLGGDLCRLAKGDGERPPLMGDAGLLLGGESRRKEILHGDVGETPDDGVENRVVF